MENYRLDKTAFQMYHTKEERNNYNYWKSQSLEERLSAANYLNSVAYNFPVNNPPRLDKKYFKSRTR
ncbi:MAG: hypothetical protein ACTHK8_05725 [Ginsengibacter sp.]